MSVRVVLVHGSMLNANQWYGYRELLGPDVTVVTPTLPGHGDRAGERFTVDGSLAAIGAAVGDGPDTATVLAGHSLGGYLVLAWAAAHPGRLAGLALLGSAGDPSSRISLLYKLFGGLIDLVGVCRADRWTKKRLARMISADAHRALYEQTVSFASVADSWPAITPNDFPPSLMSKVDCPVLLVAGRYDQMRVHTRRYAAAGTHVRSVVVPRAGHMAPLTRPDVVARALRSFIKEVAS